MNHGQGANASAEETGTHRPQCVAETTILRQTAAAAAAAAKEMSYDQETYVASRAAKSRNEAQDGSRRGVTEAIDGLQTSAAPSAAVKKINYG